jgi:hypothetical protein
LITGIGCQPQTFIVQLLRTSREPDNGHGLRLQQSAFSIAQKANALSEMGTGIKIGL